MEELCPEVLLQRADKAQRALMAEECILVDLDDSVVGHASHLRTPESPSGLTHRAFSVFLFNDSNELLLQKRSKEKITFPLLWTNTCCSHPLFKSDEMEEENLSVTIGIKTAARRRMNFELGISEDELPHDCFQVIGRIQYIANSDKYWAENEVDYILFTKTKANLTPNTNEISAIEWISKQNWKKIINGETFNGINSDNLTPWFLRISNTLLEGYWNAIIENRVNECVDLTAIHRL